MHSELEAARHRAAQAGQENAALHQELAALDQEIAALHASTSWLVTAPLRFLKRGKLASRKYHGLIRRMRSKRGVVARGS